MVICIPYRTNDAKNDNGKQRVDTDEHHEDCDEKHEEEGHISRLRNMLKPMIFVLIFLLL